ncbi:MAG: MBL fold metallo-hydrolase, partial [Armatimonadota bacterium]|nr:MBL fold metallo-hydrolase [Armatimonadota bacterium]
MRRLLHLTLAMLGVLLVAVLLQNGRVDAGKKTKVTWLGHASFRIETPRGRVLYIDPWLKNPQLPAAKAKVDRADFVLITHGHFDHVGEAVE